MNKNKESNTWAYLGLALIVSWCSFGMFMYLQKPDASVVYNVMDCVQWTQSSGLKTQCPENWEHLPHTTTYVDGRFNVEDLPIYAEQK